jgi:glycosyltransferase 2 family protein
MKRSSDFLWLVVGAAAVVFSFWLLYKQLRGVSVADLKAGFRAIPRANYALSVGSMFAAYSALAWYDRIALLHIGRKLSWAFVSLTSFTTYALSHSIGMTVVSGAMVRYRAYSTKGLSVAEIAVVVAFCSFTFALGTILLGGLVLIVRPDVVLRLFAAPPWVAPAVGDFLLALAVLYGAGSLLHLPPLLIGKFRLIYPRPEVMLRQLAAGPLELMGAAGIIYFALPTAHNPGFIVVLGIFLVAFSAGLLSHSPGGLGVLELVFVKGTPDVPIADAVAALIVFRVLYLLAPLMIGLVVALTFEREGLAKRLRALRRDSRSSRRQE